VRQTRCAGAFYRNQLHGGDVFQGEAYGNYLGLCRLAVFMADQMGLLLERVNVTVGVAELEMLSKSNPLIKELKDAAEVLFKPAVAA
jgi:hypothetical protein